MSDQRNTNADLRAYNWCFARGDDGEFDIPGLGVGFNDKQIQFEPDYADLLFAKDIEDLFGAACVKFLAFTAMGETTAYSEALGEHKLPCKVYDQYDQLNDALCDLQASKTPGAHVVQVIAIRDSDDKIVAINLTLFWRY